MCDKAIASAFFFYFYSYVSFWSFTMRKYEIYLYYTEGDF